MLVPCSSATGANLYASPPAPRATLAARFAPKHLGQATTVTVGLRIRARDAPLEALRTVELRFPSNLGFATSGLGLAVCNPAQLELEGALACPANSKMGTGTATVGVAFGTDEVEEQVTLSLFAAPSSDGYVHVAILAVGKHPIVARIVMAAVLLPGRLRISVPLVPSLPGAPDVSVLALTATLGGELTYYETSRGRTVAYHPRGIGLPASCPRGGWHVGASLTFLAGGISHASTIVHCPEVRHSGGH
jgi:hypothetical protein